MTIIRTMKGFTKRGVEAFKTEYLRPNQNPASRQAFVQIQEETTG